MGVLRHRHHSLTAFAFLLFASAAAVITLSFLSSGFQGKGDSKELERILTQKRLDGLGSSPPSCRSKCGNCSPCNPVHVPIHPGFSFPQEYYPEAWRCKCGNKLFMP